jgi:hypothetical protein
MNQLIISLALLMISSPVFAAHEHLEKDYQAVWCQEQNGELEVVLDDKSRVDCITDRYAVEFDFAPKWAEGVGQALYYAEKTGKEPGVVLIVEEEKDKKHLPKIQLLSEKYGIGVWTMTPADLNQKNVLEIRR